MYEVIVRIARAIACLPRLRILSCMASADEVMPTDLARELGMSRDLVAAHLRRLSAAALIQRRRSGVRSYCIASSPYAESTISGEMATWLRQILGNPRRAMKNSEVEQARNYIMPRNYRYRQYLCVLSAATRPCSLGWAGRPAMYRSPS